MLTCFLILSTNLDWKILYILPIISILAMAANWGWFILRFILSLCQNIERHFLWPLFSLLQCSIAAIRMLQLINGMVLKIYMHKPHPVCQHHSLSVSWVPRSSTCPLKSFFWLLTHVIYLKLTRVLYKCLLSQAE